MNSSSQVFRNMYTKKASFPHWAANYLAFYMVCAHMCTCTHTLALTKTHHDSCGSPKTTRGGWFSPSTCLSWELIELSSLGLVADAISPLPLFPRPSGQLLVILLLNIFIMLQYHYYCAPEIHIKNLNSWNLSCSMATKTGLREIFMSL